LHQNVCKAANGLKSLGIQKGDRVTIYLTMIPELAYIMLACARIGAVHSIIFGGFSPDSIATRITDCESEYLITADEGVRGGKIIPLKKIADEALDQCPGVKKCVVVERTGNQVDWNNLDFLVIDLPPGTGDAQISLSQSVPISAAIVVTTPQQVSLQDARRGLAMFKQLGVPLLGIVENMSVFIPPDMPSKKYEIFGKGGGQTLAKENDLPLLAKIPIEIPLVDESNKGVPISISQPNKKSSIAFSNLAQLIKSQFVDR